MCLMTTSGKGKIALAIAPGRRIRNVVEARAVGCEQTSAQFSRMDLRPSRFDLPEQRGLSFRIRLVTGVKDYPSNDYNNWARL